MALDEVEAAAQARLSALVVDLEGFRERLQEIGESLPASPREETLLEEGGDWDAATELRSVIECVLADRIEPAIRDLAAAASYRLKEEKG